MRTHHGTPGGYSNHRCREACCKAAWAADTRRRRAEHRANKLKAEAAE